MAGQTNVQSLADSLPTMIHSAYIVREYDGVYMRTCDTDKLPEGQGTTWQEIALQQISGQSGITENTELDNPQQLSDLLLTATPVVCGIQTRITNRAKIRIDKKVAAKLGVLAQNAITRLKDETYISTIDGATTSQPGAGNPLTSGVIGAFARQIRGNTTEPNNSPIYTVLHPFQLHDIQSEIVAGVGTYTVPNGITEEVWREGLSGSLFGTTVYEDGNIPIDGSDDAKGGVHAKTAIVLVQGRSPWNYEKLRPEIGGGAVDVFHYDEYVFVERNAGGGSSGGGHLFEVYSDALAPTS